MISINPFYTQLSQLCSINFSWIINISIVQLCLYNVSQLNIENASALSYFYCTNFNLFLVFVIFFVGHFPIFVFYFIFLRLRIKLRLPTVSNLHIWAENCRQRKLHTYIQPCTYTLTHTYTNTLTSNQPHTHTQQRLRATLSNADWVIEGNCGLWARALQRTYVGRCGGTGLGNSFANS